MSNKLTIQRILDERVFAVLRLKRTEKVELAIEALIRGGMKTIEITMNSHNAGEAIHRVVKAFPSALIGAGTVIGVEAATMAVESGAKFLVSPVTDLDMLAVADAAGVASMAGAFTPTEAWQADQSGADFVKLFPLAGLGPPYLRALRGPFPDIRFVPTNGVTVENVAEWFEAGAAAVGVGTPLITDRDMETADFAAIEKRAHQIIKNAKPRK